MADLQLKSSAFSDGSPIPEKYGYTKDDINPPLSIERVPEETQTLALVMDDPDAKEPAGKIWDHWVIWNIPSNIEEISEDPVPTGAVEGKNDYGKVGYGGPNPPDRTHTYRFKLYALNTELDLAKGAIKEELRKAMKGHVIEKTMLTGTYSP